MNLNNLNNSELTHYRFTITIHKDHIGTAKVLDKLIHEQFLDQSPTLNDYEIFDYERGGIYEHKFYRELKANEYNVSLGQPEELKK